MKFDAEDMKRGWAVCRDCQDRIVQLDAGFDAEESKCIECDRWSVRKCDFFIDDSVELLGK